jgi:xanthine/uracil permease
VKRFLHARRLVTVAVIVVVVIALGIGLWPVHANVFSDSSYSCGSGFIHNTHTWNVDSTAFEFERSGNETAATSLPATACPNKVDSRRDFAVLLLAFSLAIGLIAKLMLDRPRQPNFGTTFFANRRRGNVRAPVSPRRAQSEDPSVP